MLELRTVGGARPMWRLKVADSFLARLRGLMGTSSLAPGEGLYLPRTNSVHMLFMRFPIDCSFLSAPQPDGTRRVLAVHERLAPWKGIVWWVRGARGAVEVPAGAAAEAALRRGDTVVLQESIPE